MEIVDGIIKNKRKANEPLTPSQFSKVKTNSLAMEESENDNVSQNEEDDDENSVESEESF